MLTKIITKWKKIRKLSKKGKEIPEELLKLTSAESYNGDILSKTSEILRTQKEHILPALKRFMGDING